MIKNPLPKLGRPFQGDSKRDRGIKFYLNDSENQKYENLELDLKKFYDSKGYYYNRSLHFRLLLNNLTDPLILDQLFKNLTSEFDFYKNSKNN